jgi:hypothetical protein
VAWPTPSWNFSHIGARRADDLFAFDRINSAFSHGPVYRRDLQQSSAATQRHAAGLDRESGATRLHEPHERLDWADIDRKSLFENEFGASDGIHLTIVS